jgi:hypothetical protein
MLSGYFNSFSAYSIKGLPLKFAKLIEFVRRFNEKLSTSILLTDQIEAGDEVGEFLQQFLHDWQVCGESFVVHRPYWCINEL